MDQSEVKHFPKVDHTPAKITKLSEAIRLGCLMQPASTVGNRVYFDRCGSCALGAAYQALTGRITHEMGLGAVITKMLGLPEGLVGLASDKFENGQMSREQVADWLESQGY